MVFHFTLNICVVTGVRVGIGAFDAGNTCALDGKPRTTGDKRAPDAPLRPLHALGTPRLT